MATLEERSTRLNERRRQRGQPPVWTPETIAYADGLRNRNDAYTINFPCITDVIRLDALESDELRFQRWLRMKNADPLLPDSISWIPKLINKLDDAQDLLFTGLALAWPIIKRLPKMILGPLGWALLVNDILNLGT